MRPPLKVDELGALPYPVETIRHWYVSPFGGRSEELDADQVGVNREALVQNTDLAPEDRVAVAVVGTNPPRPWFFEETLEVVPLDARTPQASGLSPHGEIVLPNPPFDFVRRPHLQPAIGEAVVLKGAALRLEENPEWLAELVRTSLRRPDG
jgi:hypothetical protein